MSQAKAKDRHWHEGADDQHRDDRQGGTGESGKTTPRGGREPDRAEQDQENNGSGGQYANAEGVTCRRGLGGVGIRTVQWLVSHVGGLSTHMIFRIGYCHVPPRALIRLTVLA